MSTPSSGATARDSNPSSSDGRPQLAAPGDATDCHIHIYDERFPPPLAKPMHGTVADYRRMQSRLGLARVVIVQPRNYATDNAVTLDAIAQLGIDKARGIAVLRPNVSDAELKRLNDGGIRGIRFTTGDPKTAVVTPDMIEPLAARIAAYGWHVQLNMPIEHIVGYAGVLDRIPTQIVFDHMGKVPSLAHPAYRTIRSLIDKRKAWVKISGAYINSEAGPPDYPESVPLARAYVAAAPERCVWGSDWPHPGPKVKPDDAALFDLFGVWVPDAATRKRMLVDNPEGLYGFPGTATA
jgi:predicted TIM-barrel fold metal-dependent hydrolase